MLKILFDVGLLYGNCMMIMGCMIVDELKDVLSVLCVD